MVAKSYKRGHEIVYDDARGIWLYADNGQPADDNRPCPRCGCRSTPEGHDTCLGYLPGMREACCGHGRHRGYSISRAAGLWHWLDV